MRLLEPKFIRRWIKHLKAHDLYEASGTKDFLRRAKKEGRCLCHEDFFNGLKERLKDGDISKIYQSAIHMAIPGPVLRYGAGPDTLTPYPCGTRLAPNMALARDAFFELDDRPKKRLIVRLKPDVAQRHECFCRGEPLRSPNNGQTHRSAPTCDCPLCQCGALTTRIIHGGQGRDKPYPYIAIGCLASDADALCKHPDIEFAEEDGRAELVGALDDTTTPTGDRLTWGYRRIKAEDVYKFGLRGQSVKVAVIDTGVDYTHEDLKALYKGGYDFYNEDGAPMDDHWHGTHVAGTICAVTNGVGYRGVAPMIELYAVKVLGADGSGYWSDVIQGIDWCRQNGIEVINMSLGGYSYSQALKEACDSAMAEGITLVAAAGNAGSEWGVDSVSYPAKFDSVIAVTATMIVEGDYPPGTPIEDMKANMPAFASIGPAVDFGAPGSQINSTVPLFKDPTGYLQASGTSMASPHVAGLVTALKQAAPSATPDQIKQFLIDSAVPEDTEYIHPGWNVPNPHPFKLLGYGEVRVPSKGTLLEILQQPAVIGRDRVPVPYILRYPNPQNGQTNIPIGNTLKLVLKSDTWGIDIERVRVKLTDSLGVNVYDSTSPHFKFSGNRWAYEIEVKPPRPWQYEENVQVEIEAEDFMGNPGVVYEYLP